MNSILLISRARYSDRFALSSTFFRMLLDLCKYSMIYSFNWRSSMAFLRLRFSIYVWIFWSVLVLGSVWGLITGSVSRLINSFRHISRKLDYLLLILPVQTAAIHYLLSIYWLTGPTYFNLMLFKWSLMRTHTRLLP